MKKILFIGKINDSVKGIEELLEKHFMVQICPFSADALKDMLKVVTPDLAVISLSGASESDSQIFHFLKNEEKHIPVLTIGDEQEKAMFLEYYADGRFENIQRPADKRTVIEAVCKRVNASLIIREDGYKIVENREKKLVMIVDDNAMTLRSIKEMLSDVYDVSVATSGMKALTSMGKNPPDLILLDYEMPVCDGKQTLEMIRADDDFKNIPVIFLTGVSDREHVEAVLNLKPAGYILKPPIREKLLETIRKNI